MNVGENAKVYAEGMGRYGGRSAASIFKIEKVDLSTVTIQKIRPQWHYADPVIPALVVTNAAGDVLNQDVDYTATFEGNDKAGIAKVTITGNDTGTFGTNSATFVIVEAAASLKGSGTAEDPYLIGTKGDLQFLADKINSMSDPDTNQWALAHYKLTADIDATAVDENDLAVDQIGVYASGPNYVNDALRHMFAGTFDGDNHTITQIGRAHV